MVDVTAEDSRKMGKMDENGRIQQWKRGFHHWNGGIEWIWQDLTIQNYPKLSLTDWFKESQQANHGLTAKHGGFFLTTRTLVTSCHPSSRCQQPMRSKSITQLLQRVGLIVALRLFLQETSFANAEPCAGSKLPWTSMPWLPWLLFTSIHFPPFDLQPTSSISEDKLRTLRHWESSSW